MQPPLLYAAIEFAAVIRPTILSTAISDTTTDVIIVSTTVAATNAIATPIPLPPPWQYHHYRLWCHCEDNKFVLCP